MKKIKYLLFIPLFVSTVYAELRPIVQLGYEGGGEEIASVDFSDGYEKITSADGFVIEGGMGLYLDNSDDTFFTTLLVGYKIDSIEARNGNISFSRFTATALEVYNPNDFSIAGGLTYHFTPSLDGDGFIQDFSYDDALGIVVELGYFMTQSVSFKVRGTFIEYEESKLSREIESNSLGVFLSFEF